MLTYISEDPIRSTSKRKYAHFKCDCGDTVSKRKDTTALYCSGPMCTFSTFNRHGKSDTRLYSIWSGIRDRCINGCHVSALTYKDKGITISPDWDLFSNFESWALSNGYTDELTIDRIDIDCGYSAENCEWVTRAENTRRQIRDGHTNQKAITMYSDNLSLDFPSINACAQHVIDSGFCKSTNQKSVATIISAIVNKTYRTDRAYGFYFTEAK